MKLKETDYQEMKYGVMENMKRVPAGRIQEFMAIIKQDEKVKDPARYMRWATFKLWGLSSGRMAWMDKVYTYCNDDHLDTAFRRLASELAIPQ